VKTQRAAVAICLALVIGTVAVPVHAAAGSFVDDDGNIHEPNIEAIAADGITKGCNPPVNDRFCPDDPVTRGQMAAFLNRALHLPATAADFFTDDNDSVFEADINRLAAAGITKGCDPPDNTTYCPDASVTRGQMAAFLVRGFGYTDPGTGDLFTDDDGSVFEDDIDKLGTAGVTKGCNPPVNDRFCPDDLVRRDEMASFLGRALGLTPVVPPTPAGEMTAVIVAVRQGSAALYQGPCGETGLIDVNRFRADDVLAAMDALDGRDLAWISVSHYDSDHLGDVVEVATSTGVSVGAVYDRGGDRTVKDSDTYRNYFDWATGQGLRNPVDIGDSFSLCTGPDEVTFTVVSAGTDRTAAGGITVSDENDRGLCLHVEFREFDLATCGDIDGVDDGSRTDVESVVAPIIGDVEFAVVNHHGSPNSSNPTYVSTLSAQASVISVGKNSFGHPDPAVVARWDAVGDVYQTQDPSDNTIIDGDTTVTTDGLNGFTVATEAGAVASYGLDP
jgi:beta-lactamase superfamily II metal-dependent hydrolase